MKWLTQDAVLVCQHQTGRVNLGQAQDLVTVNGRTVLVENDPEFRPITGCSNIGATIKPCTLTLKAMAGYSAFIRINGRRVALDTITGLTEGTPPSTIKYQVRSPGQELVDEA